jgi:hypothetical protein
MRTLSARTWLTAIALAIAPATALAQGAAGVVQQVAGPLGGFGGGSFGDIVASIASSVAPLVTIIALLAIVIATAVVIISQDEGQLMKAWKTIFTAGAAVILVNATGLIYSSIYPGISSGGIAGAIVNLATAAEVPVAVIAVLMIIVSGVKAVVSYGSDEGLSQLKRTVIGVVAGIILLMVKLALSESVTITHTPEGFVGSIVTVMNIILAFAALVATAVIIIAGFMMILNVGNEEQYTRARTLVIRVGIGLIVIIISLALANVIIFAAL